MPRRLTALSFDGYAGPILSGLLLALCYPKPDQGWLAWFALLPLLMGSSPMGESPARRMAGDVGRSFKKGFTFGFVFFLLLLYWIYPTCRAGGVVPPVAAIATLSLAAFLALIPGIFMIGAARLSSPFGRGQGEGDKVVPPLALAALWVTLEMVREHVMGFPWELLGYTQWRYPYLTQISSVTGVHGLSFLIVWFNASLANLFSPTRSRGGVRGGAYIIGPPAIAVLSVLLFGAIRLNPPTAAVPTLKVALLQGNIDQYKKWDEAFVEEIKNAYSSLLDKLSPVDLVVWPESSLPGWLDDAAVSGWLADQTQRSRTYHLVGAVTHDRDSGALNAAVLSAPDGTLSKPYAKRHLVPFGEYVPLQSFLGRWAPILNELGGITAGTDASPLDHPKARLGASVCYEVVFPDETRRTVYSGATVLVNVTNDGWYLDTAGPYQHLAMSALRAVENDRPLVRAANTGVSAVFDRHGRLAASLPLGTRDILYADIQPRETRTFFSLFGEIFAWLCVAAAIFTLLAPWARGTAAGGGVGP